jgi:membrane protein DedA with SNARE-associated domain/rhodanese-related sulfurtransferase
VEGIGEFIARYGLVAVLLVSFLENIGLPIPALPVLLLAGAYASTRHADLSAILLAAIVGALSADVAWYFIGRWRGKGILSRLCRISFNPDACLERSVDGFHRRKAATILFAKFLPGVNTIMPPLAGVSGMRLSAFLLLDTAGAFLWAASCIGLGFAFGEEIAETARGVQGMMGWIFLGGLAATVAWRIGYRFWLVKRYGGNRIEPDEVYQRIREGQEVYLLDLRRDDDYDASDRMISGAFRLRPASFHRHAMDLPRNRDLVLYCTCPGDATSASLARTLIKRGYDRVSVLHGGFDEWVRRGFPTQPRTPETSPPTTPAPDGSA